MVKKTFFLILFFYLLALFQTIFFPHFWPVLIAVVLINLFEGQKENSGLFGAFFGGFFLDIFSENFIGFWILISLAIAAFIKFVFKKHVQTPIFKRFG